MSHLYLPDNKSTIQRMADAIRRLESIGFKLNIAGDVKFSFPEAVKHFNAATLYKVFALGQILEQEHPLTVRGAFYRAVSSGIFPNTSDAHYNACKRLILQMRRKGLIPYFYISDSTRRRLKPTSWSGLADYAEVVASSYRKDLWSRQWDYIEVFCEKDAMAGIIHPVTHEFDVGLNIIRGNCSETFVYDIAEEWNEIEKPTMAYYLGDHDPNGLKIEEDLRKRLHGFVNRDFNWKRLAVTSEDFADPSLLGFPVKRKGPKGSWRPYLEKYSDRCVEVDAIPASIIRQRVRDAILSHVDPYEWNFLLEQEEREKVDVLTLVRSLAA